MKGIVFLDRDGTIIEDEGYLAEPDRVREIPGAAEALRRLKRAGYLLAVVSNQSGLARGMFDEAQMEAVHRAFVERFRGAGVEFDAVEYCPHHPEGAVGRYRVACGCRKPATGMADRILARLAVPASCKRWMVGDKMSDVLMGRGLGAATILVATGYGEGERTALAGRGVSADLYVPGIREAADRILSEEGVK